MIKAGSPWCNYYSLFVIPEGNPRLPSVLSFPKEIRVAVLFVIPEGNLRLLLLVPERTLSLPRSLQPKLPHRHLQIFPRLRLLPRVAQQKRRMKRHQSLGPAHIVPGAAQ